MDNGTTNCACCNLGIYKDVFNNNNADTLRFQISKEFEHKKVYVDKVSDGYRLKIMNSEDTQAQFTSAVEKIKAHFC